MLRTNYDFDVIYVYKADSFTIRVKQDLGSWVTAVVIMCQGVWVCGCVDVKLDVWWVVSRLGWLGCVCVCTRGLGRVRVCDGVVLVLSSRLARGVTRIGNSACGPPPLNIEFIIYNIYHVYSTSWGGAVSCASYASCQIPRQG